MSDENKPQRTLGQRTLAAAVAGSIIVFIGSHTVGLDLCRSIAGAFVGFAVAGAAWVFLEFNLETEASKQPPPRANPLQEEGSIIMTVIVYAIAFVILASTFFSCGG